MLTVRPSVFVRRRQAAMTPVNDAEHDREDGAERDHRQGVDQGDAEVRRDGLLVLVRDAEVPMGELLQVDDVLLPLRLVEPELHLECVPQLLGRVRHAREVRDGGAGREPEEDEVDRHRHEDGDDRETDPLQDIVGPPHEEASYFWCTCVRLWMFSSLKGPCGVFWKSAQFEETAATESSFASQRYGRCLYRHRLHRPDDLAALRFSSAPPAAPSTSCRSSCRSSPSRSNRRTGRTSRPRA